MDAATPTFSALRDDPQAGICFARERHLELFWGENLCPPRSSGESEEDNQLGEFPAHPVNAREAVGLDRQTCEALSVVRLLLRSVNVAPNIDPHANLLRLLY